MISFSLRRCKAPRLIPKPQLPKTFKQNTVLHPRRVFQSIQACSMLQDLLDSFIVWKNVFRKFSIHWLIEKAIRKYVLKTKVLRCPPLLYGKTHNTFCYSEVQPRRECFLMLVILSITAENQPGSVSAQHIVLVASTTQHELQIKYRFSFYTRDDIPTLHVQQCIYFYLYSFFAIAVISPFQYFTDRQLVIIIRMCQNIYFEPNWWPSHTSRVERLTFIFSFFVWLTGLINFYFHILCWAFWISCCDLSNCGRSVSVFSRYWVVSLPYSFADVRLRCSFCNQQKSFFCHPFFSSERLMLFVDQRMFLG